MKISAVSMRRVPDGVEVSVSAVLAANEELDGSELGTIERVIKEFAGAQISVKQETAPAGEPSGRRRRGAEPAEVAPATATSDAAPTADTGRRRRGGAAEPATAPAAQDTPTATATSPSEPRRRRSAPEPEAAAPVEGRRRRVTAEPEAPKAPSDSDLVKAATSALEAMSNKVGAKAAQDLVLDLMYQYDDAKGQPVENIANLKADDREEFLKRLKATVTDNS